MELYRNNNGKNSGSQMANVYLHTHVHIMYMYEYMNIEKHVKQEDHIS